MIYIYRQSSSAGARQLSEAVNGRRWRLPRHASNLRSGDVVVCWGEATPQVPSGVRVINGAPLTSKFTDAQRLKEAGVATIEVSRTRPVQQPAQPMEDPARLIWSTILEEIGDLEEVTFNRTSQPFRDGVRQFGEQFQSLLQALERPVPTRPVQPVGEWIGRADSHVGGNDLLRPVQNPDYFARKEDFRDEVRIHSFNGRSIRAGAKRPREGVAQHPWIRSWDGGWRIVYDGVTARQAHRDLAHAAVNALELQFGAVDIGIKQDGTPIVLEVNRAPGLEGGTIDVYASAIQRLVQEGR